MAVNVNDSISAIASTSEEISAQAQEIAAVTTQLAQTTLESREKVKETDNIIALIRDIAAQTNLLDLKAAIEAARVGEALALRQKKYASCQQTAPIRRRI